MSRVLLSVTDGGDDEADGGAANALEHCKEKNEDQGTFVGYLKEI